MSYHKNDLEDEDSDHIENWDDYYSDFSDAEIGDTYITFHATDTAPYRGMNS